MRCSCVVVGGCRCASFFRLFRFPVVSVVFLFLFSFLGWVGFSPLHIPPSQSTDCRYPQELIITFDSVVTVSGVSTKSFNCKKVTLLKSIAKQPSDFVPLADGEIPDGEGQVQEHKHEMGETVMRHLKIIIESGKLIIITAIVVLELLVARLSPWVAFFFNFFE